MFADVDLVLDYTDKVIAPADKQDVYIITLRRNLYIAKLPGVNVEWGRGIDSLFLGLDRCLREEVAQKGGLRGVPSPRRG